MTHKYISIFKAKQHNLKNISVDIPKDSLTVITGPSGSGKSSLAFDTIYIEGQRRYIESLSSYARQFLGQFLPPDVESISGLSPSIAIDQKSTSHNPRSTVGTITEIYDYFRILFARVGDCYCPKCGEKTQAQSIDNIVESISDFPENTKIQILAPIIKARKGEHQEVLGNLLSLGLSKVRVDNQIYQLSETIDLAKNKPHTIEAIIDRLILKKGNNRRLFDSIEYGLKIGNRSLIVLVNENEEYYYSQDNSCSKCEFSFPPLEPNLFSFNSPIGACSSCKGLGETSFFDKKLIIGDTSLSINEGALKPIQKKSSFFYQMLKCMCKAEKIDLDTPYKKLTKDQQNSIINGNKNIYTYSFKSENSSFHFKKEFPGIIQWLEKKYLDINSDKQRNEIQKYLNIGKCTHCDGKKLNTTSLNVKFNSLNIYDISQLSIKDLDLFIKNVQLSSYQQKVAEKILVEIKSRVSFLINVGLNYLTLSRNATTLSGGENQRIRLATQIGSALTGVTYVLDEPSIGLHQKDNLKLINTLKELKKIGNTVIVVEHDEDTIRSADYIIDMGPKAGLHGGEITAKGNLTELLKNPNSLTAKYLNGENIIEVPKKRKIPTKWISVEKINQNNIKNLNVEFPLNLFLTITGVSGSGKSSLLHQVLIPAIKDFFKNEKNSNQNFSKISGLESIDSLIELDQSPIGRTPKSNPGTYTGAFDLIREIFSFTNDSKMRGYKPGRFSFNVKGGRCEECEGNGTKKIEMHFLPDVYITCDNCQGRRYNRETLSILYKGKSIYDVLEMTIEEAYNFFNAYPKVEKIFKTLIDVGLSYMKLGQSATTLSGGEAQRLKLSKELSKKTKGHCLYILDEPTTGLHFDDIKTLLKSLHLLVEQGNSLFIIEHNLDVIKTSDYIIDLGPEGGSAGGNIIAKGTPEEIVNHQDSYTGKYLKKYLQF